MTTKKTAPVAAPPEKRGRGRPKGRQPGSLADCIAALEVGATYATLTALTPNTPLRAVSDKRANVNRILQTGIARVRDETKGSYSAVTHFWIADNGTGYVVGVVTRTG